MEIIFFAIVIALIAYLIFDFIVNYQRNRIYDRITYGFVDEQKEQESSLLTSQILDISALKTLTNESAILKRFEYNLERSGLKISTAKALLLMFLFSLTIAAIVYFYLQNAIYGLIAFLISPLIYWKIISIVSDLRAKKHDNQLGTLLATLLSTMRSGGTPLQALHTTSENSPEPIASSIANVLNNLQLGRNPNVVWKEWGDFWNTKHTKLLSSGIRLKWETGGEMTKMLEHIQESFEFSKRIELRVASLTAMSKLSAIVLSLITPAIAGLIYSQRPDFMDNMIHDEYGKIWLMAAAGLVVLGFFWMRSLAKLK